MTEKREAINGAPDKVPPGQDEDERPEKRPANEDSSGTRWVAERIQQIF